MPKHCQSVHQNCVIVPWRVRASRLNVHLNCYEIGSNQKLLLPTKTVEKDLEFTFAFPMSLDMNTERHQHGTQLAHQCQDPIERKNENFYFKLCLAIPNTITKPVGWYDEADPDCDIDDNNRLHLPPSY